MKNPNKDKVEVYFTIEFKEKIKDLAKKLGITAAEVVRRGTELIVKNYAE